MNTTKLLALRELAPIDKLVILAVIDNTIFNECRLTSQDIATAIGLSRKKVIDTLDKLCELDYITCKVEGAYRLRKTKLTQRLLNLIKE